MFEIKKAKRQRRPLKVGLEALSGGGKSYTALRLAFDMIRRGIGKRVVMADSENESGSLYAGTVIDGTEWDYETLQIPPEKQNPNGYAEVYEYLVAAGYDIVIMDSMTHAWKGALNRVDEIGARNKGDKFGAGWRQVTPEYERMVRVLTDPRAHLIATNRVKGDYERVEENGRVKIEKVGFKTEQRDGFEYELDCVIRMDPHSHHARVEKVRGCVAMDGRTAANPGPDFWKPLFDWWLSAEPVVSPEEKARQEFKRAATLDDLVAAWNRTPAGVKPAVLADKDRRKAELLAAGPAGEARSAAVAVAGHALVTGTAAVGAATAERLALEQRVQVACGEAGYDDPDVAVRIHHAVLDAHDATGGLVHWRDLADAQLEELLNQLQ